MSSCPRSSSSSALTRTIASKGWRPGTPLAFVAVTAAFLCGANDTVVTASSGPANSRWEILVTDAASDAVRVHDLETGAFIRFAVPPGAAGIDQPLGFVVLPDRSIAVSSDLTDRIHRFDPRDGTLLSNFESTPLVDGPAGLELGPDGLVYCASGRNGRVLRYGTDGTFIDVFVNGMVVPEMMVWDGTGRFLVGDWWTNRINAHDAGTGALLEPFAVGGALAGPLHGHVRGNELVVANLFGNRLTRYELAGGSSLPPIDLTAGGAPMSGPVDFVDLPDGTMLVSSTNNGRILRYTQSGDWIGEFTSGNGMLSAGAMALMCPLDVDGDDTVGFTDALGVLSAWGPCDTALCPADTNVDGAVDFSDLIDVLSAWGDC